MRTENSPLSAGVLYPAFVLAESLHREAPHLRRQAMPGFAAHARQVIDVWGARDGASGDVTRLLRDMGRFAAATWAIYLEETPGGLTLARVSETLRRTDTSGPGRASAILTYLRFIGYVERAPELDSGRERRFRTTTRLRESYRERLRRELEVRVGLDPAIAWVLQDFERRFLPFFVVAAEVSMHNLAIRFRADPPPVRNPLDLFSERFAGIAILLEMMNGAGEDDEFPPRGPLTFTVAEIARRCDTSRTQVSAILKAARRAGSILPAGDGRERLSDELIDTLKAFIAGSTDMLIGCARLARNGSPTFFD